jgi:hypothetical protein
VSVLPIGRVGGEELRILHAGEPPIVAITLAELLEAYSRLEGLFS